MQIAPSCLRTTTLGSPSVVEAATFVRKMRGGSQSHLIYDTEGNAWVTKSPNNPQGRRTLVNEWLSSIFLEHLGIATPSVSIVNVSERFLDENEAVHLELATHRGALQSGWHFGSRFPGDPARVAVYDFLPDTLLPGVENVSDFRGALVFDQWMGNADARQAIFYRQEPSHLFVAQMIDNGKIFEGADWRLTDSPLRGVYFRPAVYRSARSLDDFQPWLDRVEAFPEKVVRRTADRIPSCWLAGEEERLRRLLDQLLERRRRVPDLVQNCLSALFPRPA